VAELADAARITSDRPAFAENRWWPLAAYLVVVVALAWLATFLADRREYGAGLIRRRDLHGTRLNIHSCLGLTARLARQSILIWTVAVACIGTLFSAMGSGVVQQSQQEDLGGFLGSQLGAGNPVAGYFGYFGTVVGMAVTSFAVLGVLRARQDEVDG
jgi:ABC-2 type transport system permease protein